jgi:hypothetical protein
MGGAFSMMLTCLMAGAAVVAAFFIDRDLKRAKEKQEKGDDK